MVWPEAEVKFYLDADLDTRARRRQTELAARGVTMDVAAVAARHRAARPPGQRADAGAAPEARGRGGRGHVRLSLEEVVERMLKVVEQATVLYAIVKPIAVALMRLLFRLEVLGREHVPATGPVLIVSNHVSVLDPPFVGGAVAARAVLPRQGGAVRRCRSSGDSSAPLNARPVKRDGSDGRALKAALKLLGENRAILVFPEGTRGVEGRAGRGKAGGGDAGGAERSAGGPRVRVRHGAALPPGRALPRPARVTVTFGPPLLFKSAGDERRKERYREATEEMMRAIGQLMEQRASEQ